jgi:U3 small nucleolar RNA-associated protein 12
VLIHTLTGDILDTIPMATLLSLLDKEERESRVAAGAGGALAAGGAAAFAFSSSLEAELESGICSLAIEHATGRVVLGLESGGAILVGVPTLLPSGLRQSLGESVQSVSPAWLPGHRRAVTSCLVATHAIVIGSQDTSLSVWDPVSGSPVCRLSGHTGPISSLAWCTTKVHENSEGSPLLASGSLDGHVRLWSLAERVCVQVITGHRQPVHALTCTSWGLVTGAADGLLRVWAVDQTASTPATPLGSFARRGGSSRVADLTVSPSGEHLVVAGVERSVEVFSVLSDRAAAKRSAKRVRRAHKKFEEQLAAATAAQGPEAAAALVGDRDAIETGVIASDVFQHAALPALPGKPLAVHFTAPRGRRISVALHNNAVAVLDGQTFEPTMLADVLGHRSEVRALAMASDDSFLVSLSSRLLKVWPVDGSTCLGTVEVPNSLSLALVPGNRFAIVGTKKGALVLVDTREMRVLHTVADAHAGPIWSIAVRTLGGAVTFISVSADRLVKFWQLGRNEEDEDGSLILLESGDQMEMTDEVLAAAVSRDGSLLGLALLDNTVRVFQGPTLEFHLSLYGHTLPVLALAMSADQRLAVTGSSDKSVRIWGLDFGDCHHSLRGHEAAVTAVAFVSDSNRFFSAGKDGSLRYWDAVSGDLILDLRPSTQPLWAIAAGGPPENLDTQDDLNTPVGVLAVAGADRGIRVYRERDDQVFVAEEREIRMEKMLDRAEQEDVERDDRLMAEVNVPDATLGTVGRATKRTLESTRAGERLSSALEIARGDRGNPEMLGLTPEAYILRTIRDSVTKSHLEEALLTLSYTDAVELLHNTLLWLDQGREIELSARTALFLVTSYESQLTSTAQDSTVELLHQLDERLTKHLRDLDDVFAYNLAAIRLARRISGIAHTGAAKLIEAAATGKKQSGKRRRTTTKVT